MNIPVPINARSYKMLKRIQEFSKTEDLELLRAID